MAQTTLETPKGYSTRVHHPAGWRQEPAYDKLVLEVSYGRAHLGKKSWQKPKQDANALHDSFVTFRKLFEEACDLGLTCPVLVVVSHSIIWEAEFNIIF